MRSGRAEGTAEIRVVMNHVEAGFFLRNPLHFLFMFEFSHDTSLKRKDTIKERKVKPHSEGR